MFIRENPQRRANGAVVKYVQLVESVWNREKKRSEPRVLYNFGRADDPQTVERLRRLARNILRRVPPEEIVTENPEWRVVESWPYGHVYVPEQLWRRLGLPEAIERALGAAKVELPVERALFATVANRAVAPASKLACWVRWLGEDLWIQGTDGLELHHLYRAMGLLHAHREALEEKLFFRLADLFNLEVDLVFYDTTSLYFEADEEDGSGPRKRGYLKDGRGAPRRSWWGSR